MVKCGASCERVWPGVRVGREDLKPGDHVFTYRYRGVYSHHGIYDENGMIIQYGPNEGMSSNSSSEISFCKFGSYGERTCCQWNGKYNGVVRSCIDCFLGSGMLYRYKYSERLLNILSRRPGTCTLKKESNPSIVLHRANHLLLTKNGFGQYKSANNNCEDFAIYCKTGLVGSLTGDEGANGQAEIIRASEAFWLRSVGVVTVHICKRNMIFDIGTRIGDTIIGMIVDIVTPLGEVPVEKLVAIRCKAQLTVS